MLPWLYCLSWGRDVEEARPAGKGLALGRITVTSLTLCHPRGPSTPLLTHFLLPQPRPDRALCNLHAHTLTHTRTHAHTCTHAAQTVGDTTAGPAWPPLSKCLGGRGGSSRSALCLACEGTHPPGSLAPTPVRSCLCGRNRQDISSSSFWADSQGQTLEFY